MGRWRLPGRGGWTPPGSSTGTTSPASQPSLHPRTRCLHTAYSPPYSSISPCQVGREWRSEMSSLTTKYNTKLRAAQQRNKELRAELAKLQVRPGANQACKPCLLFINELSPSY